VSRNKAVLLIAAMATIGVATSRFRHGDVNAASEVEGYMAHYGQASSAQLTLLLEIKQAELNEITGPYFERAFEAGDYESRVLAMTPEGGFVLPQTELLAGRRLMPSGELQTAVLPAERFASAYALHREMRWMLDRIAYLEAFERRASRASMAK